MGATGVWHPPKFWTSPLAPTDFEVLNTKWHLQSLFYVKIGTLSFKFLTQALTYSAFSDGYFGTTTTPPLQIFMHSFYFTNSSYLSSASTLLWGKLFSYFKIAGEITKIFLYHTDATMNWNRKFDSNQVFGYISSCV